MTATESWTGRAREWASDALPPDQLLPDRQPAYVTSLVYVFGVLTIAGLVMIIASGTVLALQGPQWYHGSSVGHFINSVHLWSVELFFFCMVVHLWAKFFMAGWRGRRAQTWVTGAVAFVVSVACAFTGYAVQSNFDSQWITTQAKDGINATGIGAWFNVLDFGQMLLFHALLLPAAVIAIAGLHVLLVRRRGVVPPLDHPAGATIDDSAKWDGPTRPYDLLKEFTVALVTIAVLSVGLAALFSSPDEREVTISGWAKAAPNDVVATATAELDGSSGSASYGAPYNHNGPGQKLGPLALQRWAGVTIPIDSATVFVVDPLRAVPHDAALTAALSQWDGASGDQQTRWASAYDDALQKAPDNDPAKVASGDYGPVPVMTGRLLALAQSGGLDGALLAEGRFYATDYTRPLLFIADGTYLSDLASNQHLLGSQWGMMNETGRYPGQAWLWLYTFWYQVPPFNHTSNADVEVWALMMLLTLALILVPFIPGVRSIPRWVPVHRLIWRDWYAKTRS